MKICIANSKRVIKMIFGQFWQKGKLQPMTKIMESPQLEDARPGFLRRGGTFWHCETS